MNGIGDETGFIEVNNEPEPLGQILIDFVHTVTNRLGHGHGVRPALFADPKPHRGPSVRPGNTPDVRQPIVHRGHILNSEGTVNRGSTAGGNDQTTKFFNGSGFAHHPHVQFLRTRLDPTRRNLRVLGINGGGHVLNGHLVTGPSCPRPATPGGSAPHSPPETLPPPRAPW
jgi:hypothetical protein